jgi:hypothetical protein
LVKGTGFPSESRAFPVAVQLVVAVGLNVHIKVADAPAAKDATLAGRNDVQPVPVTLTFVIVESPVFVSITLIVTGVPEYTVVPGVTLLRTKVVAGWITVTVPLVVSFVVGIGKLLKLPFPVAVHVVVEVGLKVHMKFDELPAARLAILDGVQVAQPVPVTNTLLIVTLPVFVSVTVIVTGVPDSTVVPGDTDCVVSLVAGWGVIVPFIVASLSKPINPAPVIAISACSKNAYFSPGVFGKFAVAWPL